MKELKFVMVSLLRQIDTDNSIVIARGKGKQGGRKEGKGEDKQGWKES